MSTFSEEVSPIIPQYETEEPAWMSHYTRQLVTGKLYLGDKEREFPKAVKWAATLVLWLKFAVTFQFAKGNKLVLFRWNVTKGLVGMNNCNEA